MIFLMPNQSKVLPNHQEITNDIQGPGVQEILTFWMERMNLFTVLSLFNVKLATN